MSYVAGNTDYRPFRGWDYLTSQPLRLSLRL